MTKNMFKIDFFEFSFLVEACIPTKRNESSITEKMFWDKICTDSYPLGNLQKKELLKWIERNPNFDLNYQYCKDFYDIYSSNEKSKNKDVYNTRIYGINFEEFKILVSATIPPRPIARAMFWNDVCDTYYHEMTPDERVQLFEWILRSPYFKLINDQCAMFYARFNPKRQYIVHTQVDVSKEIHETYRFKGRYYTSKNKSMNEDYITKIVPIK